MKNFIIQILTTICVFDFLRAEQSSYSPFGVVEEDKVYHLLNITSQMDFNSICVMYKFTYECSELVDELIAKFQLIDPKSKTLSAEEIEYNKQLGDIYFIRGEIDYFGVFEGKPNILKGIISYIYSAFIGNAKALHKMYILLETDIYSFYYTKIQEAADESVKLDYILRYHKFMNNFNFHDAFEKQSLSELLLYSSALFKYPHSMTTMAYKYFRGYGLDRNCEASKAYYSESAHQAISNYYEFDRPSYYEKNILAQHEYVGYKYSGGENQDINQLIEYIKLEAQKGLVSHINYLGQRYLYGQGIDQNFSESLYYFTKGAELNDTTSIFYLGEQYLNGYGVEKNYTRAFELFEKCQSLGYTKAMNSLGYMYYYGLGVEKNVKRAYDYFKSKFIVIKIRLCVS